MASGIPLEKANDLFNRLADIKFEDVENARRIAIELRSLNAQRPGDFITKVALAEAYLLSGNRAEAVDQMIGAFGLRNRDMLPVMDRLAVLLFFVAQRDKALTVANEIAFQPGVSALGHPDDNMAQIATWAGDFDLLRRLRDRDNEASAQGLAGQYLEMLETIGTLEDMELHQRTVIEVMKDVQIACTIHVGLSESNDSVLVNGIFFDRTKATRRELETALQKATGYALKDRLGDRVLNVITAGPSTTTGPFEVILGGTKNAA